MFTGFPVVLLAIVITVSVDKAPEGILKVTLLSEVTTVPPSEPIVTFAKTSPLSELLFELPSPPPPPPPPHPVSRVRERIAVKMINKKKDFLREIKLTD